MIDGDELLIAFHETTNLDHAGSYIARWGRHSCLPGRLSGRQECLPTSLFAYSFDLQFHLFELETIGYGRFVIALGQNLQNDRRVGEQIRIAELEVDRFDSLYIV